MDILHYHFIKTQDLCLSDYKLLPILVWDNILHQHCYVIQQGSRSFQGRLKENSIISWKELDRIETLLLVRFNEAIITGWTKETQHFE